MIVRLDRAKRRCVLNNIRRGARTSAPGGAPELDDTDRKLIAMLADDARTPNSTLAAQAGIAPSTCLMRVRRLQGTGVVRGFHAEISPEALGLPLQAIVVVRLQGNARARIGEFGGWLSGLPGVLNVFFLAGGDDFQVHVAAASPDALRTFVVENLSANHDVAMTETHLIFEHLRIPFP